MKNVFKKAAAAVMAFTLLGAGTTFKKPITADTNTITASAATVDPNTPHSHGQFTSYTPCEWSKVTIIDAYYNPIFGIGEKKVARKTVYNYFYEDVVRCKACNGVISRKVNLKKSYKAIYSYGLFGKLTDVRYIDLG